MLTTEPRNLYDLPAELGVIGAILMDPERLEQVIGILEPGDFYQGEHGAIFRAMLKLHKDGQQIDETLLTGKPGIDPAVLHDLVYTHPQAQNIRAYARIVKRYAGHRRLKQELTNALATIHSGTLADVEPGIVFDELAKRIAPAIREPLQEEPRRTIWTAAELLAADFPEPQWTIPGVLPMGLAFLAGRPKVGKSWLGLQIAVAVGSGGRVFDRVIKPGRVLYLALEDSERRLKTRLGAQDARGAVDVTFATEWPTFGGGGLVKLQEEIRAQEYNLVVIDTLSRASGMVDQLNLADMTNLTGELQNLTKLHQVTILVIDHHRKSGGQESDPIDDILGSTGKGAVCDVAWGLYKERGKAGATLKIVGRDLEPRDLALEWDTDTCCWQLLGDVADVQRGEVKKSILQAIADLQVLGELATVTNLAAHLDREKGNIGRALADLVNAGKVGKAAKVGREQPYILIQT